MNSVSQNVSEMASQPPITNRGVTPVNCAENNQDNSFINSFINSFFDWYQVTIPDVEEATEIHCFLNKAKEYLGGEVVECDYPDRPYSHAVELKKDENTLFKLSFNGPSQNKGIFVKATSSKAHAVSLFLKAEYPDHNVSRADIATDYDEKGAFERLIEIGFYVAEKFNLKINQQGDWQFNKSGRTLYIGSKDSPLRVRIYEKGKEQREKGIDPNASLDWARIELQVRPKKKAKRNAAYLQPSEYFGASAWYRELALKLNDISVTAVPMGTVRNERSTLDKKIHYMLYQYGNTLELIVEGVLNGDWALLGDYLRERMDESKNAVKSSRELLTDS